MNPLLAATIAAVAAAPVGWLLRRNLARLAYRTEAEADLPHPGPRTWVVWVTIAVFVTIAAKAALHPEPALMLPVLPVAIAGPWLAAVDLDVMRLPNRVLALTAAASITLVAATTAITGSSTPAISAAIGSLAAGGLFAISHTITRGGIGYGDVKLAAIIGLAIGHLGLQPLWLGLLAGTTTAFVWARLRRHAGPVAYGPWLLLGVGAALLAW